MNRIGIHSSGVDDNQIEKSIPSLKSFIVLQEPLPFKKSENDTALFRHKMVG